MTNLESLTQAQQELYDWLIEYIRTTQHAPSIRQMMRAMNLRSPAPIQSRLERLRAKGYIDWTEGKARTLRILK
ncbi:MAG: repressor LexA, partial [Microcystis sp. M53600_WE12]|nr:repressor LexA [Microcystis sp. M53600_WE12]